MSAENNGKEVLHDKECEEDEEIEDAAREDVAANLNVDPDSSSES